MIWPKLGECHSWYYKGKMATLEVTAVNRTLPDNYLVTATLTFEGREPKVKIMNRGEYEGFLRRIEPHRSSRLTATVLWDDE